MEKEIFCKRFVETMIIPSYPDCEKRKTEYIPRNLPYLFLVIMYDIIILGG